MKWAARSMLNSWLDLPLAKAFSSIWTISHHHATFQSTFHRWATPAATATEAFASIPHAFAATPAPIRAPHGSKPTALWSIQRLATACDVDRLFLTWISVTVTNVELHNISSRRLAAHALLDIEEHLNAVLRTKSALKSKSISRDRLKFALSHIELTPIKHP